MIATCAVPADHARPEDTLDDRRDEAIIRLMFDTAIRSGELVDLRLDDLDLIARWPRYRRAGPAAERKLLGQLAGRPLPLVRGRSTDRP